MSFKPLPPVERVRELLHYEPSTGLFTWKVRVSQAVKAGHRAGSVTRPKGYIHINIEGSAYKAHRLAWLHFYGVDPLAATVDHKDLDTSNNCISNLRLSDCFKDAYNRRRRPNSSGFKGVAKYGDLWRVRISSGGIRKSLGLYKDLEEARKVYEEAALKYHGDYSRLD